MLRRTPRHVREVLTAARDRAWQAVNTVMVDAYWEVGRVIVEDEQAGKQRASYGRRVLDGLAERLQAEFGNGFDLSNRRNMRAFFVTYPIRDALRRELSWTHYRHLLRVDNPAARAFYKAEAVNARWATRELDRQINLDIATVGLVSVLSPLISDDEPARGFARKSAMSRGLDAGFLVVAKLRTTYT